MLTYFYFDERRTVKYWKKVAFNMIARMVLNAYLLYLENNNGKKMTRLQFYSCIIETISNEWIEKRNDIYHGICDLNNKEQNNQVCGVKLLPGKLERNCLVCHNPRERKRSRTVCITCEKGLHTRCAGLHKCPK